MSKIVSIEEYRQRKIQERATAPHGIPKKHINWSPKLTDNQKMRIQEPFNRMNKMIQELKDTDRIQLK